MTRNELVDGQSRVGFAWDRSIQEPYAAMLRSTAGDIELVIPFDQADNRHFRRYAGRSVNWGDDPDLALHDYHLPDQFWFADAHGFVSLTGIRAASLSPLAGGPTTLTEAKIRAEYAVFSGDGGVDYTRINGMRTRVEGLARWFGQRSVSNNLQDPTRPSDEFAITIRDTTVQPLDRRLNLSLVAGVDWQLPGEPGDTTVREVAAIRTSTRRAQPWSDHRDLHNALHALLELSAWTPLRAEQVHAMHRGDPQRVLSGKVVGNRWAPVASASINSSRGTDSADFMFTFDDIGPQGVRRWLKLQKEFKRGIAAMTFSISHGSMSLDGLISDAGIGLEMIGHTIDVRRGGGSRRGHHLHLLDLATEVDDILPFDGRTWASDSTGVYNAVKHADRTDPSADEMYQMLIKNRLVFRVWVARRLGASDAVINRHMWRLKRGLVET